MSTRAGASRRSIDKTAVRTKQDIDRPPERTMQDFERTAVKTMHVSEAPSFEKRITHSMLQERVEIPVSFIRVHGHLLNNCKVVTLTGPNGLTFSVAMTSSLRPDSRQSEFRHYLSHGWVEFAKENGIQPDDCVTFQLNANAYFHVHVSSPPLARYKRGRRDKQGELGNDARNHAEEATQRLDAAISSNSRFPQYIRKLAGNSHNHQLELPYRFAEEYKHRIQPLVHLQGPSGACRTLKHRVSVSNHGQIRVQFCHNWRAFSLENLFEEGDVLLFSLVGFSKFVVRMFLPTT